VELAELIRGAQEAMDRGDFLLAASACAHALDSYPACLAAHRLRGEALLERGELDAAVEHFERVLGYDPLHVVAHLGLGVAAEERHDTEHAYVHYLHAWEINPALDQVREQLVKLRIALGGPERLHPTRVGLAHIHARTGQFGRAAGEWRAILAADPGNPQARTALLEVLWRSADDSGALALCQHVLRATPDNVRALAIQAEIEQRQRGHASTELVERYRAIDPLGEIAAHLGELRPGVEMEFLLADSVPVPDFDFQAAPEEAQVQAPAPLEPAMPALGAHHVPAPDLWDSLVRDLQGGSSNSEPEDLHLEPFSWSEDADLAALAQAEPFSVDDLHEFTEPLAVAQPLEAAVVWQAIDQSQGVNGASGMGMERVAAAEDIADSASSAANSVAGEPAPAPPVVSLPPSPASDPFVTADGRVDLTVGWDELDRTLQEATPSEAAIAGYEDLLAELDAGGVAPFVAEEPQSADAAWEPFTAEDLAGIPPTPPGVGFGDVAASDHASTSQPAAPGDDLMMAASLVEAESPPSADQPVSHEDDWGILDEDLLAGIPGQESTGYTEFLRHIDQETLPPLPEEPEVVDPLALPDTAGDPLDFDALLAVTSRDGTAPLDPVFAEDTAVGDATVHDRVASDDLIAQAADDTEPALAAAAFDADLAGIKPFSLEEIVEHGPAANAADFSDLDRDPASLFADLPPAVPEPDVALQPAAGPLGPWDALESGALGSSLPVTVAPAQSEADHQVEPVHEAYGWPEVVSETSELIDRRESATGLFTRLRLAKQQMIEAGAVVVDRALAPAPVVAAALASPVLTPEAVVRAPAPPGQERSRRPVEEPGLDLMAMRLRLIESTEAAQDVAAALETLIAQGYGEPLALRVLGEAYLRLGKTEQAAAQFRQAMLARRRSRPVEAGVRSGW
jgi:tetratricopeptide (TPR) repeat protein